MKISVNTIRYINQKYGRAGDPAPEGVDILIQKIGAQLGAVEETFATGKKYVGVVIVKVMTCEQHPNADRLHVCMIDDGGVVKDIPRDEKGLVQVVCGAPNVHAGVTVAWLPPGATVPSTYDTDPFVLEARELRGVVSNGMLASPKELALGDSHEGLLIIEEEVEPGTMFADRYGLRDDVVIDMENKMFTHRPDCFGWLGVAREIAGIQGQTFKSPDWYRSDAALPKQESDGLRVEIRNEIPEIVPRFMALPIAGITVGPSPVWLQVELSKVGIRPINNIVDLTNFYMVLTGQPLHAYDYDKVLAQDDGADHATIVVRKPRDGEKLVLLNGKEIEPRKEAILIASDTKAIGIGGVMGGSDTEVDENTKNIILECASFDMYSIRRTSMAHGIFSDAVTRFTKGQSPLQNQAVLAKVAEDVLRICGGQIAGEVVDDNHVPEEARTRNALHDDVRMRGAFINERLGLDLLPEEMAGILSNVEFTVEVQGDELLIRAPFWRTDIEIPEDIVEEVGRLYGFDKLPLELPMRTAVPARKNQLLEAKSKVRRVLSSAGANEVLTYSFVHGNLLDKVGQDTAKAFKLSNALSPDLQYYRMSLTPSLLASVHPNIKAGHDEFALFEIGKSHIRGDNDYVESDLPEEKQHVGFVYANNEKNVTPGRGAAYYQAKHYLATLLDAFGFSAGKVRYESFSTEREDVATVQAWLSPYEARRSALVLYDFDQAGETKTFMVGVVGELTAGTRKGLKLPEQTAAFELDLSLVALAEQQGNVVSYVSLPRFPKVTQDISLKVVAKLPYRAVYDCAWNTLQDNDEATDLHMTLSPLDIYQREDDKEHKQVALRLTVASYEKTMTDAEVAAMLDAVASAVSDQLGAERL
jgi:phenylalanyl-tRNA synthetase beta chain